jgi:hypothetical protein
MRARRRETAPFARAALPVAPLQVQSSRMHDPEERPRFRWRMLAWGIGVLILVPVLYVAASGPLTWWRSHQYRPPPWYAEYQQSLKPLDRFAEFKSMMRRYRSWWVRLPAPRSWERQRLVDQLAHRRKVVEDLRAVRARLDAEAEALRTRLDALESKGTSPQEVPAEAIGIRLRLDELGRARGRVGSPMVPLELRDLPNHEARALNAEAELKRFDAQ